MSKNQSKTKLPEEIFLGKLDSRLEKLDLIEIQKKSWQKFIDFDLKEIISEFFPIYDFTEKRFVLEFIDLFFGEPRYSLDLCLKKKLTYDVPVYLRLRLINKKTGEKKEQDVYFFNLPKMTERGTFIINGIERAIINQLVRSPGVYFTAEVNKITGVTLYNAEIRPYIGAWIDVTLNKNNLIEMKINKKRKFLATTFIKAF
jgi:DNA-directed RNA polymerase subunit beta